MGAVNMVAPKKDKDGNLVKYNAKMTVYMVIVTILGSFGGLLFGYDLGVTGGVQKMETFTKLFFKQVYEQQQAYNSSPASVDQYCTFDSGLLELFTSIAYIGGLLGAPLASICTQRHGRKPTLWIGGGLYLAGAILMALSNHVGQIFMGRVLVGFGSGFANQVTPIYLAEAAPAQWRGAINICFQLNTTIGLFVAQLINYGVNNHTRASEPLSTSKLEGAYGWRISLAMQGVPAIAILLGLPLIPETPNSLIERNQDEKALKVLRKLRGTQDVQYEFNDIKAAAEECKRANTSPWRTLFKPQNAFMATTVCCMPFFQQFTGVNIIMFYAPQIFSALGQGSSAALLQTVINGAVNVAGTLVAIGVTDHFGRRILLLEGGYQMIVTIFTFGAILGRYLNKVPLNTKPKASKGLIAMAAIYTAGYAWSWGPICWLIPSEILTLETRAAGTGINTSFNFLFTFVVAQSFLSMFCHMKYGVFFFFGCWIIIMVIFVHLFVVETFRTPIEEVHLKYMNHWFWGRVQKKYKHEVIGNNGKGQQYDYDAANQQMASQEPNGNQYSADQANGNLNGHANGNTKTNGKMTDDQTNV